jgi:parallel beta-helix repeat protein
MSAGTNVAIRNGTISIPSGTSGGNIKFINVYGGRIEGVTVERPFDDPGIAVERSAAVHVEGNRIRWGQAIGAAGNGNAVEINERSQDIVFRGNVVEGCSEVAVQTGSRSVMIEGNTDIGAASSAYNTHGTACEDVTIRDNILLHAVGPGIAVGQSNTLYPDQRVLVEGNLVYNCGVNGISVAGSAGSEIRGVTIRGNRIHRFAAVSTGRGIVVSRATDVTIEGNDLIGHHPDAAAMVQISASTNVRVRFNSMRTGPNTYGVQITNATGACDSITVEGNDIAGLSSSNIRMDGATHTNVWVLRNKADDNTLTVTSGATLSGNIWGAMYDASISSDGRVVNPGYAFQSEVSLGFYRSATSTIDQSYGTFRAPELWGSGLSIGGTGTVIPAISSTSSLIAAFVVQGSSSSFTIVTWAAAKANDIIMVTPTSLNGAVSSLSSGIVAHSHCTQNGQVELRLSNVSTLAQNVSTKTWFFTRITPF